MDKTKQWVLLASFISEDDLNQSIQRIAIYTNIDTNSIFILKNLSNCGEFILTYNIPKILLKNIRTSDILPNTTIIHRNKKTNTLYSLNAMNMIISKSKFNNIDWNEYINKIIVCHRGILCVFDTVLYKKGFFIFT